MELDELREADIDINGHRLTFAQSMTLRVAIGAFVMSLGEPDAAAALGNLGANYTARCREIEALLLLPPKGAGE